jgi:hypothetical protein
MIRPAARGQELRMSEENRHEAADLDDYSTQEPADSLTGQPGVPGDDPLDRGVAPPERWSSVIRTADEPESLDDLLAEEEPDETVDDEEESWDENETGADVARLERDDDADPRAGRLAATEADVYGDNDSDVRAVQDGELLATDTGIDGGAASAEEAVVPLVEDPDDENDDDE